MEIRPIILAISTSVIFLLSGCKYVQHHANIEARQLRIDTQMLVQDQEIEAMIQPYKETLEDKMNEVIGILDDDLQKHKPNSTLGNWFADVLAKQGAVIFDEDVDFAIQNYGGLRIPEIKKGELTVGQIYELMPFDNTFILVDLRTQDVLALAAKMAQKGGWPISEAISYTLQDTVASDIMIHGEPLANDKVYKVIIPDYIANGGDNCHFLVDLPRKESSILLRDGIIDYVRQETKAGRTLHVDNSKRINR